MPKNWQNNSHTHSNNKFKFYLPKSNAKDSMYKTINLHEFMINLIKVHRKMLIY